MIVALLKRFVAELPSYTIRAKDGSPYLTRWYVWPRGEAKVPRVDTERDTPFAIYVHYFHRSDRDYDPHNHPWDVSVALVLAGGYTEQRGDEVRTCAPGAMNVVKGDDFHKVTLLDEKKGSWSLFVAGKRIQDWGFKKRETGEVIPWRTYLGIA